MSNEQKPSREQLMEEAIVEVRRLAKECHDSGHGHGEMDEDAIRQAAGDLVCSYEAIDWLNHQTHDRRHELLAKATKLSSTRLSFALRYGFLSICAGRQVPAMPHKDIENVFFAIALVEMIYDARLDEGWVP